jgi:hypothetical protein
MMDIVIETSLTALDEEIPIRRATSAGVAP